MGEQRHEDKRWLSDGGGQSYSPLFAKTHVLEKENAFGNECEEWQILNKTLSFARDL